MKKILFVITCALCIIEASAVEINLAKYKVKAEGRTYCTAALQKAIDDCSAQGVGRVVAPDVRT